MDAVTVSPKSQVVIPKAARERAHIMPGEKLQVLSFDDRIELVRTHAMREMRGERPNKSCEASAWKSIHTHRTITTNCGRFREWYKTFGPIA